MSRKILSGLISQTYEHPFDRQALASLQNMPGISPLLKKVNEYGIDRFLTLQTIGSQIKVTSRNFPQLYKPFLEVCKILEVTNIPELYLFPGKGHIKTYIIGVEKSIVGINLDGMEWLNYDELLFIFGYEIAKIKSQYMIYHQMSMIMPTLKIWLSSTTLGLGGLVASGVELALYNWVMMAKFTADRVGLLACQDINIATTALIKLAGLPEEYLTTEVIEDFVIQSREFTSNSFDSLDQVTKILSYSEANLSWLIMRTGELLKWVDSGEYDHVLQGENVNTPKEEEEGDEKEGWNFLTSW
ncbi:MAG: M48 family metallopeptidase [Cuspidothrix sp.]